MEEKRFRKDNVREADETEKSDTLKEVGHFAKNAGLSGLGEIVALFLNFLAIVLITRIVGAKIYGVFILAEGIITILIVISLCGLGEGLVKYISHYNAIDDVSRVKGTILYAMLISFCLSIAFSTIVFIFAEAIAVHIFHDIQVSPAIKIMVFAVPFLVIMNIALRSIHGFQVIKVVVLIHQILKPSVRLILLVIFFLMGFKLFGLLFSFIITALIITAIAYYKFLNIFPLTDRRITPVFQGKELINFSWPLFLSQFLAIVIHWTDIMMLGFFLPSKEVGIYGVVIKVGPLIALPLNAFNLVFAPFISELYALNDLERLAGYFKLITKWIFTFSFPVFLFYFLYPSEVLNIFGNEFTVATIPLFLICIGELLNTGTGSSGYIVIMTGRPKLSLLNAGIAGGINVVLNYYFIPKYGMTGAAIATCTSMCLLNILRVSEVYFLLGMHPYSKRFFKPFWGGFISFSIFYFFKDSLLFFTKISRFGILIPGLLFFAVYILSLYLLKFDTEDRFILKKVLAKVKRSKK